MAHRDEAVLRSHLKMLLGGSVVNPSVIRLDLATDTTWVDVHYRLPRNPKEKDAGLTEPAITGRAQRITQ